MYVAAETLISLDNKHVSVIGLHNILRHLHHTA